MEVTGHSYRAKRQVPRTRTLVGLGETTPTRLVIKPLDERYGAQLAARICFSQAVFGSTERRRSRTYPAVGYTTSPVLKTSGVIASMQGSLCAWAARAPACAPVPAVVGVSVDPLLTMEVSRCHARTRAITQDTFTPANRTVLVRRDASGGVARVVSDVSVSCPRADAGLGNAPSRASASGSSRRYARHRQGRRRPEHLLRRDGALCGR
jgi:hypothetical protein